MIKVIGFDLDDTLWEVAPVIIRAEKTLDQWLANNVPALQYDVLSMRALRHDVIKQQPHLVKQITEFRRQIIHRALQLSNVSDADEISHAAIEVFLEARNTIEFFPGARQMLADLSQIYELGALSNGNADIHRLGLSDVFKFAFSAEQVGEPKPGLALFRHAIEHTGVDPDQMVYVGDDPHLDVIAAKQAGLKTIWIDHGKKPIGDSEPDQTIRDIRDLPKAIAALQ